jgi:hypothetical protein
LTQPEAPETRNVTLTVESITGPQKSSGDWPIRAIVEGLGKFSMPLFVSADVSPEPGATYQATLVQGNQKSGTDGTAPWHFFWNVLSWGSYIDGDSPVTAPQQPAQPPQQAQGVPVPSAPDGGWNPGNDIDRREALKEVSFHKQKALEQATIALGTTTESALMIADYMEQRAWLYRDALALLREPLPKGADEADEEVIDGE